MAKKEPNRKESKEGHTKEEVKEIFFIAKMTNLEEQNREIQDFIDKTHKEFPSFILDSHSRPEWAFQLDDDF